MDKQEIEKIDDEVFEMFFEGSGLGLLNELCPGNEAVLEHNKIALRNEISALRELLAED